MSSLNEVNVVVNLYVTNEHLRHPGHANNASVVLLFNQAVFCVLRTGADITLSYPPRHTLCEIKQCTQWRLCLRQRAKSQKFTGSISDGFIGIFFIDLILPTALCPWIDAAFSKK